VLYHGASVLSLRVFCLTIGAAAPCSRLQRIDAANRGPMKPAAISPPQDLLRTFRTAVSCPSGSRASALILSVATCLSLAGCESGSTHTGLGNASSKPGNYSGQTSGSQAVADDQTDPESSADDPPEDEDADNPTDVNRMVEAAESEAEIAARANVPQWNAPASLGTVRGHVVDAVTGAAVEGTVSTTAKCAGTGCSRERGNTRAYVTPLQAGDFVFDADPPRPAKGKAKPARLTLSPTTSFTIAAAGYQPLVIAHGPQAPAQTDDNGRPFTALPTLYLCPEGALDGDGDGICDAAEAGYKTNPKLQDEDEDALSDSLEFLGHPPDSSTVYDIRNLGANPHVRDIFVAVRYTKSSQHSDEALQQVKQAFAAAPWTNADGSKGISLHIVSDDRVIGGVDDVKVLKPVPVLRSRRQGNHDLERPFEWLWRGRLCRHTRCLSQRDAPRASGHLHA
jgi:hypothetical protein